MIKELSLQSSYFLLRPENSDCCPDYFSHCGGHQHQEEEEEGEEEEEEEEEEDQLKYQVGSISPKTVRKPARCEHGMMSMRTPACTYHGLSIALGHTVMDNCNNCTCQVRNSRDSSL